MEGRKVEILKPATAGSSESNDILIMISPGNGSVDINLESVVLKQYGDQIENVIRQTLEEEGVGSVKLIAKDKGALDFTIKARVRAAIGRGI